MKITKKGTLFLAGLTAAMLLSAGALAVDDSDCPVCPIGNQACIEAGYCSGHDHGCRRGGYHSQNSYRAYDESNYHHGHGHGHGHHGC